jgi:hypothetical protein
MISTDLKKLAINNHEKIKHFIDALLKSCLNEPAKDGYMSAMMLEVLLLFINQEDGLTKYCMIFQQKVEADVTIKKMMN